MNKRANKELFLAKIVIAIALVAIFVAGLWMFIGQDTIAVQSAKEAYSLYMIENPEATDKDFIYIYEDTVIVAIRNGKVVRKEYATEADAVKAALGSKDGANYSLAGTGNGKLFVVKLFEKTDDIYALGTSTLATGAEKLTIKVVSNGMIFATFDIPAEAIDRKQSPVGVTIKKINAEDYITLREDQGGFGYDIDVTNLVENNTARIAITINGPKGLVADANKSPITAYHKDKNIVSTYDAITGQISFSTTSFSPFPFVINNVVTVNTLAELREQLQKNEAVNITLGANIDIDLTAKKEDGTFRDKDGYNPNVEKADNEEANQDATSKRYYSSGYYTDENGNKSWLFFGAVVRGQKYLDLNGKTINYTGDTTKGDSALFCVDGGTLFCIDDTSTTTKGVIKMGIDHYAVWAVESTSAVGIYGGVFVSSTYNTENEPNPNRALIYSSAGEIRAYGGYFLFKNSNYVDKLDNDGKPVVDEEGNPVKESKTNGGFNVLNKITQPRIWIHPGAYMSDKIYRQELDKNTIVLVGGDSLYESEMTYGTEKLYTVKSSDLQVALKYTDKFLYRIGNTGSVPLKYLFKSKNANGDLVDADFTDMSVRVVDILKTGEYLEGLKKDYAYSGTEFYGKVSEKTVKVGDVKGGIFTFSETFTGLVRLDLYNSTTNAVYAQLFLEVVDGTNVTDYSQLKSSGNFVLLNDITLTADKYSLSNGTLYGNGYTFDVTAGGISGSSTTANYLVNLANANLDNVQIIGPVYEEFSVTVKNDHNRPVVFSSGTSGIYNSYISNAASPVRLYNGELTIVNSTLKGGAFANLDMRGGNLILDDVTTINQVNSNDSSANNKVIVGLGIVLWYEGLGGNETIRFVDKNGNNTAKLNQFNYIAKNQTDNFASIIGSDIVAKAKENMFTINADFRKTDASTTWVNAGILSLTEGVGDGLISTPDGYGWTKVSVLFDTRDLCSQKADNFPSDFSTAKAPSYTPNAQYRVAPTATPEYPKKTGDKNYIAKTDSSTNYCYYDADIGTILIRFETGKTFSFDPNILTPSKFGNTLTIDSITMNGSTVSGNITFSEADDYVITYTYTDPYNYRWNEDHVESYSVEHSKTVKIQTVLADKSLVAPVFNFNGTKATTVKGTDGNVYLTGAGGTTTTHKVAGQTLTIPKIYVKYSTSSTGALTPTDANTAKLDSASNTIAFCPVFDGVVTITDNNLSFGSSTTTLADGRLQMISEKEVVLKWNSGNTVPTNNPVVHKKDKKLYFQSVTIQGVGRERLEYFFEYVYTAQNGDILHYFVCYVFPPKEEPSCVTAGTLFTMADGTQKPVEDLVVGDMVLTFNHINGKMEAMPIIFNNHADQQAAEYEVLHLQFSNGEEVEIVSSHGFFDRTLQQYVYITNDNYEDYIGHEFYYVDTNGNASNVKLTNAFVETEVTRIFCPVSYFHMNSFTNGFLNTPNIPGDITGLVNYFDYDPDMKYNEEKMQADIEKYGLFTYADFSEYMTEAAYNSSPAVYLKVAMGKGMITYDEILAVIEYLLAGSLIQ